MCSELLSYSLLVEISNDQMVISPFAGHCCGQRHCIYLFIYLLFYGCECLFYRVFGHRPLSHYFETRVEFREAKCSKIFFHNIHNIYIEILYCKIEF